MSKKHKTHLTFQDLREYDFVEMTDDQREFYLQCVISEVVSLMPWDVQGVALVAITNPEKESVDDLDGSMIATGIHLCGIARSSVDKGKKRESTPNCDADVLHEKLKESLHQYAETMEVD